MEKHVAVLRELTFGQRVAEDETDLLSTYFVETDDWAQLATGKIDVVYGMKGAGKSALYHLLTSKREEFRERGIVLATAENPRGATVFQNLLNEPPKSEPEFIGLWKLYFACLLQAEVEELGLDCEDARALRDALQEANLLRGGANLNRLLAAVRRYVSNWFRPAQSVESSVGIDVSGTAKLGGKIVFVEPDLGAANDLMMVDELLRFADHALRRSGNTVWILLDRLDVAFAEHEQMEINALRALFRVYLDLLTFTNIRLKIFLRSDIWARITHLGFREASHVTRHLTISWNRAALLNLLVRRLAHNEQLRLFYGIGEEVSSSTTEEQEELFFRVFPGQVEVGPNKPRSFDWMLGRTRDGTKNNAPRELIHFLNSLRDVQVRRHELGELPHPEGENLFARAAFKAALPDVSKVRLEQTLYAEYPQLRGHIEELRGAKATQTVDTLASAWRMSPGDAATTATALAKIGFFEERGERDEYTYWVPFLYRDALNLVQGGAADS